MSGIEPIITNRAGRWRQIKTGDEIYKVFLPAPLPPSPPLQFDDKLRGLLERANRALGRLEGVITLLPLYVTIFLKAVGRSTRGLALAKTVESKVAAFRNRLSPNSCQSRASELG